MNSTEVRWIPPFGHPKLEMGVIKEQIYVDGKHMDVLLKMA
jgi:hypothetical protein